MNEVPPSPPTFICPLLVFPSTRTPLPLALTEELLEVNSWFTYIEAETCAFPITCRGWLGDVVPIPTLPAESNVILEVLLSWISSLLAPSP